MESGDRGAESKFEMEAALAKIFKQIKTDCPRKCKELKARCEELLVTLAEKKPGQALGAERDADPYFTHLQLACESGQSKVIEAALDGMHSLIGKCIVRVWPGA